MRLFFDARMLYHSGIGRYSRNLCAHLLKSGFDLEIIFAGDIKKIEKFEKENQLTVNEKAPFGSSVYSVGEQVQGSLLAARYKGSVNLFHYPHYNVPWFLPEKGVVTIHDLIHLRFPEYFGGFKVKLAGALIRRALKKSKRIITVSESTKKDLIDLEPEISDKIRVIYNGVSNLFRTLPGDQVHFFLKEKGLDRYILYVGNRKPHKNLDCVVTAFANVKDEFKDLSLVIIGERESEPAAVRKKIDHLKERVVDIDFVSDDELLLYYNGADVLLCPSFYEGFGFTPLEAMACGSAVITSQEASLPEVVGDAGVLVSPGDIKEVSEALAGILRNNDLRGKFAEKGIKRASLFSWEKCVRETYQVYKEVTGV